VTTRIRIRAIDWLRGLVILLMTIDHSGATLDAAHMHGDDGRSWVVGAALPAGEFLTRWITHLCAPTFVMLAGTSLALSAEKRRGQPGQTRFMVTRGLLIAALDPLWMSLAFAHYRWIVFQVIYAIGMSMVCMAWLRRLSTRALLGGAIVIQATGELAARWTPQSEPLHGILCFLLVGGRIGGRFVCAYPLIPWLSFMMLGWVLGRYLLEPAAREEKARTLALLGVGLLGLFAVLRGIDGYGNWWLHRDSSAPLQWLHVAKYPPSLTFTGLELGISLLLLALFLALDDPARPRRAFGVLSLLGGTALFYYLLHAHILAAAEAIFDWNTHEDGLAKTWIGAALTVLVLLWPCAAYRRYKLAHPDGWTRYL